MKKITRINVHVLLIFWTLKRVRLRQLGLCNHVCAYELICLDYTLVWPFLTSDLLINKRKFNKRLWKVNGKE